MKRPFCQSLRAQPTPPARHGTTPFTAAVPRPTKQDARSGQHSAWANSRLMAYHDYVGVALYQGLHSSYEDIEALQQTSHLTNRRNQPRCWLKKTLAWQPVQD